MDMDSELLNKIDRRAVQLIWGPGFEQLTVGAIKQQLEQEFGKQVMAERMAIMRVKDEQAEITRRGALDMQVCVPAGWSDDQVLEFANRENPCGTSHGWHVRRAGDKVLGDYPERNPCNNRTGYVHLMLDA